MCASRTDFFFHFICSTAHLCECSSRCISSSGTSQFDQHVWYKGDDRSRGRRTIRRQVRKTKSPQGIMYIRHAHGTTVRHVSESYNRSGVHFHPGLIPRITDVLHPGFPYWESRSESLLWSSTAGRARPSSVEHYLVKVRLNASSIVLLISIHVEGSGWRAYFILLCVTESVCDDCVERE